MYVTFEDIRTFDVVGRAVTGDTGEAGAPAAGTPGEPLGRLHDLYLDTRDWRVSWLVLEAGGLLASRRVLIGTERRVAFDTDARLLVTDLTPYDIETARDAAEVRTVAERRDAEGASGGDSGVLPVGPAGALAGAAGAALTPGADPQPPSEEERHLRSARELIGYAVVGRDALVGPVADLLVDTDEPAIAWLSVDVGSWLVGREVVVRPDWATAVSWAERRVTVDLAREQVRGAPPLETLGGLDRAYASSLARFYRLPPL